MPEGPSPQFIQEGLREVLPGAIWLLEHFTLAHPDADPLESREAGFAVARLRRVLKAVERIARCDGRFRTGFIDLN